MSEDTKQFLIKLLGGGLIVGSIAVGVIRLSSPSTTPIADDIEKCADTYMEAAIEADRLDPSYTMTEGRLAEARRFRLALCINAVTGGR